MWGLTALGQVCSTSSCSGTTSKTFQHEARLRLLCPAGPGRAGSQMCCWHVPNPFSAPVLQPRPLFPSLLPVWVSDVSGVLYLGHPVLLLHLPLCPCAGGPVATNKELWHQLGPCDCHWGQHQLFVMCFPCEWGEEGSSVSTGGSARTGRGCGCSAGNFTELQVLDPVLSPDWFRGTGRAPSSCRFLSFPS